MSPRRARCIAFDFDGTLVDSNAIKRESYFEVLAGVEGAGAEIETVLRDHPREDRSGILARVHARLAARGCPSLPSVAALVEAYSETCEVRVIACPPVPGALAALDGLRDSHALYLASATPEDALVRVVSGRGWAGRFRGVFGGPRSKVENLSRIAALEGLAPAEMVYVGDAAVDREAADEFGCAFLGFGSSARDAPDPSLVPLVAELEARCERLSAG